MNAVWTREDGWRLAAQIEEIVIPMGFHCAMGGSVLHRGWSDKDLDIYLYDRSNVFQRSINDVLDALEKKLEIYVDAEGMSSVSGTRYVYRCYLSGNRIDVFFLSKLKDEEIDYCHELNKTNASVQAPEGRQ